MSDARVSFSFVLLGGRPDGVLAWRAEEDCMGEAEVELLEDPELETGDGEPMGETELHVAQILGLISALGELLRRRGGRDFACGNQLFYYQETNKKLRVSPDVYVMRGWGGRRRPRAWATWLHGAPELIVEVASRGTWKEDLGRKKQLYREVFGTAEYLVFDPEESILGEGPLVGFRLGRGTYRRAGSAARFDSRVLDASFVVLDGALRLVDEQGRLVPWDPAEANAAGREEGRVAEASALARRLLEVRLGGAPLPAELERSLGACSNRARLELVAELAARPGPDDALVAQALALLRPRD